MKGVSVILKSKTQTGTDAFGQPVYSESDIEVKDVLIGEPSTDDIQNTITKYGKVIAYTLAIPKGDTNEWAKSKVVLPSPWNKTFNVIGDAIMGIEENIPLRWNKKVHLERLDG